MRELVKYFPVMVLLLLAGCDGSGYSGEVATGNALPENKDADNKEKIMLKFGFDVRSGPIEDARQYAPFLKYLENSTGYKFKIRFTPKNNDLSEDLGNGLVDLAAVGAVSFIKAEKKHGVIPLVRGINAKGKAEYRSLIIVHPDSRIKNIEDVRGKRMAFGNKSSTQGHLLPRIELMTYGIDLKDLGSYFYAGSHNKCAEEVISGRHDACGLQDTLAESLENQGHVRVIHRSVYVPSSGIAINRKVPEQIRENIKRALLGFQPTGRDADSLYNWHKTEMPNGFTRVKQNDYKQLAKWLDEIR